jgi:hypothetical protein
VPVSEEDRALDKHAVDLVEIRRAAEERSPEPS